MSETRHDIRCPTCGKFVGEYAEGFYDRIDRPNDMAEVHCFCDEACADGYPRTAGQQDDPGLEPTPDTPEQAAAQARLESMEARGT